MRTIVTTILLAATAPLFAQNADSDMLAGMSALRKEDHATAEQAFTRAVTMAPNNSKTWYYRGVNRLGQGDTL